ncbi:death-associated protein-like 1 isoform 1-T1 [Ciconia maguari]
MKQLLQNNEKCIQIKAGGMRVSKKQENGPVEKNAKPPGKEKTSAIASFSKTQNVGVLLAEVLSKTYASSHRRKRREENAIRRILHWKKEKLLAASHTASYPCFGTSLQLLSC